MRGTTSRTTRRTTRQASLVALTLGAAMTLASCGDPAGSAADSDGPIVIGTSLSMTGAFGGIGQLQKAGYDLAVQTLNDAGGVDVDGTKREVELVVKDNQSDPNLAGQQARELVLKDEVTALLGPCTPPITIPVVQVAEAQKVPMITTCNPTGAFTSFSETGVKYSWDMFFSEEDQAATVYGAFDEIESNKKVALFTDTEPDGVIERKLYQKAAEAAGYDVVGDYTFSVGTTDFSSFIEDAKDKGAQLVVSQMIPPDGIALWKQMKALQLEPVAAFSAKAATAGTWWEALGDTAEGTLTEGFWAPSEGGVMTDEIEKAFGASMPTLPDRGIAVASLSAAYVLLQAIGEAEDASSDAINDAIEAIDIETPIGQVAFGDDHTVATDYLVLQWADGDAAQVFPASDTPVSAPAAGLR
ncbi:ABC transporter substrate-binding protein [Nocardioides sp. 503]|uniref:ABC transporter substrate-binding protein n=1 Tax=Nocardioides sp. 503 TaxID=2508326 RepID=UPI001070609C|nr:ABC transporter substrate-binding protein [Nocardioides sp. 503]